MECPLCESGTNCEVHDPLPTEPTDPYEDEEFVTEDGMTITISTYLSTLEILIPAELCRAGEFEIQRLAESMVALCLKDYVEEAPQDEKD